MFSQALAALPGATMAAQLGWDADKTAREIESLARNWRAAA